MLVARRLLSLNLQMCTDIYHNHICGHTKLAGTTPCPIFLHNPHKKCKGHLTNINMPILCFECERKEKGRTEKESSDEELENGPTSADKRRG